MTVEIKVGDCRKIIRDLDENFFDCAVTSPPYYGLRDYKTGTWSGGDQACDHVSHEIRTGLGMKKLGEKYAGGGNKASQPQTVQFKDLCGKCGAARADLQIGLEKTPAEYVRELVDVLRGVRRVLKPDGTLWLNLGDSYAGVGGQTPQTGKLFKGRARQRENISLSSRAKVDGVKPKDLLGIPWAVAFALRDDGWYLRQEIIWAKPNPMPESVGDRCTKSHEQIFLLSKSADYYFDADAIAEPAIYANSGRSSAMPDDLAPDRKRNDRQTGASFRAIRDTRNKRSVWTVATRPYLEAHFATFPPDLIKPCILAGSRAGGHVIDPFGGAGTTGLVADRCGRNATLIELSPDYAAMSRARIDGDAPLLQSAAQ